MHGPISVVRHAEPVAPSWQIPEDRRAEAAPELRLCETASRVVRFDRAAVVVTAGEDEVWALRGSDPALLRLCAQEETVLQGPQWQVLRTGRMVALADLAGADECWPMLAATGAIAETPVRSVVHVPFGPKEEERGRLDVVGILSVARDDPVPFETAELTALGVVAEEILARFLARWRVTRSIDALVGLVVDERAAASGILAVHLGIGVDEALSLMRAQAFSSSSTLVEVADRVVAAFHGHDRA